MEYVCGKAEDALPAITEKFSHSTQVIGVVDPPRAGLRK